MKKIAAILGIALAVGVFFLARAYNFETDNPDTLRAAVVSFGESASAENTYNILQSSAAATLETDKLDASVTDYSGYDILYIDKSVTSAPNFNSAAVEDFVMGGGSVFLDNETYTLFNKEFIGAADFAYVDGCPVSMDYPSLDENGITKIQGLIWDFCDLYKNYSNFADTLQYKQYGVGVIPSTAQTVTSYDGLGIYTLNQYGIGYVFFTNPLLPNAFTVGNLSPADTGEPLAASAVGAGKLMRDYFAEFVSLKKYGYAIETVSGSNGSLAAAWSVDVSDLTDIEQNTPNDFEAVCERYGQISSFNYVRNPYKNNYRAESVTYLLNDDGYAMDRYENAYSSGTHFVSGGKWLTLADDASADKNRAYPCPCDINNDGKPDLLCGSADGYIYYYEGLGMSDNYELKEPVKLTDTDGEAVSTGAYSSPCLADYDGDGNDELLTGGENGIVRAYKITDNLTLEDMGIILNTDLKDPMPSAGDLNGDGTIDIAVGSASGELRVYYGDASLSGTEYSGYNTYETLTDWCAPCIADTDGDGRAELYAGTAEGYIGIFGSRIEYYMTGTECNSDGNNNLKFGNNCVPRFYDIDGDHKLDLICGSCEYGMAIPIDSKYFPYCEQLTETFKNFTDRNIYVGASVLTHDHADPYHDAREIAYHKNAFDAYELEFANGASQHGGTVSKVGYDALYDNMQGYDGTFAAEADAGLKWNSGARFPASAASVAKGAEYSVLVPFYLKNGLLMLPPSNTPDGSGAYTYVSAKYETPLVFHTDLDGDTEEKVKRADKTAVTYGYTFVGEDELAKMSAAALNTRVTAGRKDNTIYITARARDKKHPLYDKNYQNAVGVKVIFDNNIAADEYKTDADVTSVRDNCLYVSLNRTARISKTIDEGNINITSVNLPATIHRFGSSATIGFKSGGMMTVTVKGNAKTTSQGWETITQDGKTTFRKYGAADVLRISR